METLNCKIVGVSPLVMHNGRLADPANQFTRAMKEITSKRKKTDADYEEMARLEWFGGLYLLEDKQPCIPSYVLEASLIGKGGAARKQRMGKEAAAALWVLDDFALDYDGPRDPYELWKHEEFRFSMGVVVAGSRVMRMRAIFRKWSANVSVQFDLDLLNRDVVKQWFEIAGSQVGLMDWRPKFGRFDVIW